MDTCGMKNLPLTDLVKYPVSFWLRLGEKVATWVRIEAKSGKSVSGGQFKQYTPEYKKAKGKGSYKRQSSTRTGLPDLTLTSDMLNALQTHGADKDGVTVGWADQFNASKVVWNEDEGRAIRNKTGFPFSKRIEAKYFGIIDKDSNKKVKKQNSKVVYKIG